jgi:hypothetical protein
MNAPATIEENLLARVNRMGLRVITYTNATTEPNANGTRYWIPRDCIARDARAGIIHRASNGDRRDLPGPAYDFDGWEPWADGPFGAMFGGRYRTFDAALGWLQRAFDVRDGKADRF